MSTPEFLIFNDEVIGCEFLGERDGSGGCLWGTTGALCSLLNRLT